MDFGNAKITSLKGIGAKTGELFAKVDVVTVDDLLEYYPRDYISYTQPVKINTLKAGQCVAISARIVDNLSILGKTNKKLITCKVSDGTGQLSLIWFNALFLKNVLKKGGHFVFYGKISVFKNQLTMEHPEYYSIDDYRQKLNSLTPVYAKTKGLTDNMVIKALFQAFGDGIGTREYMLPEMLAAYDLMNLDLAIRQIHFPDNKERLIKARKRIAFDELFFFMLEVRRLKQLASLEGNNHPVREFEIADDFVKKLPYDLTKGQKETLKEIKKDLSGQNQMRRIIQGDVGSGKTIVALVAMIMECSAGYQCAMMAPTEVLAIQHYETISSQIEDYGLPYRVEVLTSSTRASKRREIYEGLRDGSISIILGTHALIQEAVTFNNLGLVITDEQHRFGVNQRNDLAGKGGSPHVMVMSATPIPRTLGLILYGDMDISLIKELPANRLAIKNCVVGTEKRQSSYNFIKKEIDKGHQAYIICPLVEESENLDASDVISYTSELKNHFPGNTRIEYLHGKMKNDQKNDIMERFSKGDIQILVSTTVIEVGINVPNATVIMIENADRFGLATLHQLRGRVGRGKEQSYCIMINSSDTDRAKERLDILNKSNDGFYIASEDLKQRGMGDMLGIKQSGEMNFKMADIYEDADILKLAARLADDVAVRLEQSELVDNDFLIKVKNKAEKLSVMSKIDAL